MKGKELIEQLKGYEDFDIEFSFADYTFGYNIRTFESITISDIGYSSKVVKLDGDEV